MALSQSLNTNVSGLAKISEDLIEKITLQNDLAGLTPLQKVQYVQGVCSSMGLNHLTQPIRLMKFNGKEIPYVTKDGGEQLRKINGISINKIETKVVDGIYIVTSYASTSDGREDSSTGVICISGLKGDALANAMMKAETKAKRRVTLSICGLGFLDESEMDTMPGSIKVSISPSNIKQIENNNIIEKEKVDHDEMLLDISQCCDLESLEKTYKTYYKKISEYRDSEAMKKLIESKDKKKSSLSAESDDFVKEFDATTGVINNG